MAQGKYTRIDNTTTMNTRRQSSSYWSTVTIVVFVALCLVGVWMMTSSSLIPGQNVDMTVQETTKNDVKDQDGLAVDAKKAEDDDKEKKPEETFQQKPDENPEPKAEEKPEQTFQQKPDEKPEPRAEEKPEETFQQKPDEKPEPRAEEKPEETFEQKPDEKPEPKAEEKPEEKPKVQPYEESASNDGQSTETRLNDGAQQVESKEGTSKDNYGSDQNESKSDSVDSDKASYDKPDDMKSVEEKGIEKDNKEVNNQNAVEQFPSGAQAELTNETSTENGSWSTQAAESENEKESQESSKEQKLVQNNWKLCNSTAGPDFIPCLDNWKAIQSLISTKHYEHRERQCPEEPPTCLVPLPEGYKRPIEWPKSRKKIWYSNVPHPKLVEYKGRQNWVKVDGEYLTFPGGGTQFKHGALHYIDFINENVPNIAWGKRSRVVLDVGCGVASFGGYLFDRNVIAMSFAPKDEHEAQVQFALERGIPAISAVMGTQRLPFPGIIFDVVHCARCRVPWHIEGGKLLLELNRLLRPGGYFVWSATPVYQKLPEDKEIWKAMSELLDSICWERVARVKDRLNGVGIAIYRKPINNTCYEKRSVPQPPMCEASDDPNAAWKVPLQACMHKLPTDSFERGSKWPQQWPDRLNKTPYWMLGSEMGVYGKPQPEDFVADYEHWKRVVSKSYINGMGINWATVRNVMDMRAIYGGFAAALKDMNLWVMNVVPIDSPDVLPVIYERGLVGIYHDWCESFSTYPRSYDLLHADHLISKIKQKCNVVPLIVEVDRILRPEGKLIVRDNAETVSEVEKILRSMKWEIRMTYSKDGEGLLSAQKTTWRPEESETLDYAIMKWPRKP
ncbi:Probable methyltransferase PMT26 [Linum grandiflorum]